MSISSIQGAASSDYISPYGKRGNTIAREANSNKTTGPDTVFFSEEALKMAQDKNAQNGELSFKDSLQLDENITATKSRSDVSGLAKKSLFSMLLESLFLAELEESAVNSGGAASTGDAQASEDTVPRQQPRVSQSVSANPLEDGEKVAEIKKVLTNFAKGKADLSDLPKAMAVSGTRGGGEIKSAASKSQGEASASADDHGKDTKITA